MSGRLYGILLFNVLHLLPLALKVLFPQANLVVSSTDRKNVSTRAPADTPQHAVELELLAGPLAGVRGVRCPDPDGFVLRGRRDVRLGEDARRPRDITDPVCVAFQRLSGAVSFCFVARDAQEKNELSAIPSPNPPKRQLLLCKERQLEKTYL